MGPATGGHRALVGLKTPTNEPTPQTRGPFLTTATTLLFAVLFKLQQLQRLDHDVLLRLTCRFSELDVEKKGFLEIGKNVPSASQVGPGAVLWPVVVA